MAGHDVLRAPRAGRRRRRGDAVELPDDDGHLEDRARRWRPATRWCSSRPTPPRPARCCWPSSLAEILPPGVLNVVCGDRDDRRGAGRAPDPRRWCRSPARIRGRAWRSPPRRPGRQARPPGAGRQGAGRRVRRRRRRRGRRGDRASPASSTPARTARRPPACSPAPAVHDDFVAALAEQAQAAGSPGRAARLRGPLHPAAEQRQPAGHGSAAWSTGCRRPRARCSTGGSRGRRARATSTRPRSSPACSRTTRSSRTRSSARSSPCRRSPTRTRRCGWANGVDYGLAVERLDHATTAGRCGCRRRWTSAASGSTRHIPLVAEMPHGGFKQSGYGKDLSVYGAGGLHPHQARHGTTWGTRDAQSRCRAGLRCPRSDGSSPRSPDRVSRSWTARREAAVSTGGRR